MIIDNVSLAGYLLMKHFKQLQIYIICVSESKFLSVNVKVRDVVTYNDYDKFVNIFLSSEEVKDLILIKLMQAGIVRIGRLN